ncbi:MAG: hypothetical protein K6E75_11140 [Lachnospiraceae bacterium]|nr:hypothetical protein [Lachnospiraceae bacterium]
MKEAENNKVLNPTLQAAIEEYETTVNNSKIAYEDSGDEMEMPKLFAVNTLKNYMINLGTLNKLKSMEDVPEDQIDAVDINMNVMSEVEDNLEAKQFLEQLVDKVKDTQELFAVLNNADVQHLFFGKVLRNDPNLDKNVYKEGAEYQLNEAEKRSNSKLEKQKQEAEANRIRDVEGEPRHVSDLTGFQKPKFTDFRREGIENFASMAFKAVDSADPIWMTKSSPEFRRMKAALKTLKNDAAALNIPDKAVKDPEKHLKKWINYADKLEYAKAYIKAYLEKKMQEQNEDPDRKNNWKKQIYEQKRIQGAINAYEKIEYQLRTLRPAISDYMNATFTAERDARLQEEERFRQTTKDKDAYLRSVVRTASLMHQSQDITVAEEISSKAGRPVKNFNAWYDKAKDVLQKEYTNEYVQQSVNSSIIKDALKLDEAGAAFDQGKRMSNEEIAAIVKKRYSNFEMKKPLTEEEFEQKFKSALKGVQDYKKKMLSDKNLDKQGIPRPQQNRVVR